MLLMSIKAYVLEKSWKINNHLIGKQHYNLCKKLNVWKKYQIKKTLFKKQTVLIEKTLLVNIVT